jgi:two-component system alkaline phosphatase synthesis response regulator PhoP
MNFKGLLPKTLIEKNAYKVMIILDMEPYLIDSVEDDADIAHIINATLTKQGYEVRTFPDGESFLDSFAERKPNMVLLDMMLPGIQGKDILKQLRGDSANDDIQVIIISAKTMIMDKVDGLDLGADDYIEKPFDLMELMSRVNAHARRNKAVESITIGAFSLDLENKILHKKNAVIDLTPSEYKVLELLFKEKGKTVTREQLASALYDDITKSDSRTLDMYVKSLRNKLGDKEQNFIISIYGSGYKIS